MTRSKSVENIPVGSYLLSYLDEHMLLPDFFIEDVRSTVDKWLKDKINPSEIERMVNEEVDVDEEDMCRRELLEQLGSEDPKNYLDSLISKSLPEEPRTGVTYATSTENGESEEYHWVDNFNYEGLPIFYEEAFEQNADGCIYVNEGEFCGSHLIAVKGRPSIIKIADYAYLHSDLSRPLDYEEMVEGWKGGGWPKEFESDGLDVKSIRFDYFEPIIRTGSASYSKTQNVWTKSPTES